MFNVTNTLSTIFVISVQKQLGHVTFAENLHGYRSKVWGNSFSTMQYSLGRKFAHCVAQWYRGDVVYYTATAGTATTGGSAGGASAVGARGAIVSTVPVVEVVFGAAAPARSALNSSRPREYARSPC